MAMAIAFIIMFFGILIGGHLYGRYLASFHSTRTENTIAELRAQAQKETRRSNSLSAQLTEMEAKLEGAQAALDSIMPAPNTYTIYPNLTRVVGDGRLMVGMVGTPGNDAIMLNVNGKQQPLAAGQTINVAPDPKTRNANFRCNRSTCSRPRSSRRARDPKRSRRPFRVARAISPLPAAVVGRRTSRVLRRSRRRRAGAKAIPDSN